jgi:hypothetical protein
MAAEDPLLHALHHTQGGNAPLCEADKVRGLQTDQREQKKQKRSQKKLLTIKFNTVIKG